ncbi:MAG: hypothetical protein ACOX1S_11550 [Anaerostipes sp.]|jgi:hypothetical protein
MIYDLVFDFWDDNPQNDDCISVAVYSSYALAKQGLEKFKKQPRFKGKEDFFFICEREVNEENEFWSDGYYTEQYSDYYIDLDSHFVIKKYGDDFSEVIFQESQEIVLDGTFHFYDDGKQYVLLKNSSTGWMYCVDKNERQMTCKTKDEELLLNHIKKNYQICTWKWKKINDD